MANGQTSKLEYLTHHEAGHAAVAFSFGLRLERVGASPSSFFAASERAKWVREVSEGR
jgi:hypothetical protein